MHSLKRHFLARLSTAAFLALPLASRPAPMRAQGGAPRRARPVAPQTASIVLGRPTDKSVSISVLSPRAGELRIQYGRTTTTMNRTVRGTVQANLPLHVDLDSLAPGVRYRYRVSVNDEVISTATASFLTQRPPGTAFTFSVQGDSHPERAGRMFDDDLYLRTMRRVRDEQPDFYLTLGDDFSIEGLISQQRLTADNVNAVYANQRRYLGIVGESAPIYLVNGNHEEAARVLLDGSPTSAPVLAGRARTQYFPLPAPDAFYTGDAEDVPNIGLLRDYYAWTWGDALFVVIDPYWHSNVQVDAPPGGGGGGGGARRNGGRNQPRGNALQATGLSRDMWNITLGDAQYAWLRRTLESSKAKYKFVFAHHVMGTGRGGVEEAGLYEWGGRDRSGANLFAQKRPAWAMPIHDLFVATGVSVFFQGHDHLFARQEKDGVVYQETPNPADATYQTFNRDAYRSGDVLPNAGHLRVTVSSTEARVDYIRSFLPKDETATQTDGVVAFSYTVKPRGGTP